MTTAVAHILELIDSLPEADRQSLERELSQRAESEWRSAATSARRQAAAEGIDQQAIDDAVSRQRYEH